MSLRAWVVMTLCLGFLAGPLRAQTAQPSVAILVVSSGTDARMNELEQQATSYIKKLRAQQGLDVALLPILSYHFNKPAERKYCEQKLGIKESDLLFVGVVQQQNMVVKKILKGEPRVQDPKSEAFQMFRRVALILGFDPTSIPGDPGKPPVKPTPTPVVVTPTGDGTLALTRLVITNEDGIPVNDFSTSDKGVFFNVFVKNLAPNTAQDHDVRVTLHTSDPKFVAPPLGGKFSLQQGDVVEGRDVLRLADPDAQGLAIAGQYLGDHPDTYQVQVSLDGKVVGEDSFRIKGQDIQGVKQLSVAQAFLGDNHGQPQTDFKTTDVGVFCFVILKNEDLSSEHQHTISVRALDPDGKEYGPQLGGPFVVKKGEDISAKEFPGDADAQGANGFLIKDALMEKHPGTYRVIVTIDGVVVKEMSFTISQ